MTFDLKMWHALRVHICLVCFAYIVGVLYWLFYRRIWINSCLGVMNSKAIFSFCTHLTFDLILRLRRISRLGIHPHGCWHTSRNTISMDATFYSFLPSEEFFSCNGLPTIWGVDLLIFFFCKFNLSVAMVTNQIQRFSLKWYAWLRATQQTFL